MSFVHDQPPVRIVFRAGSLAQVPAELERLGVRRCLILHGGSQAGPAGELCARLEARCAGTSADVREHVPVEVAERARERARGADGLVALGGGSVIGVAKAVALTSGLPILAVPTTYAGSEMTALYGLTEGRRKRTGVDPAVRPRTVVYDPDLTLGLPREIAAASAMNALAHCVDALWAPNATPVTTLLAEEGARHLRVGLDEPAADRLLYGSALAGWALTVAGTALHHKLCHVLGGAYDLPHAGTHAALLPHTAALIPRALTGGLAAALEADDLRTGIHDLAARSGAPTSLREIGLEEDNLGAAAALAAAETGKDERRMLELLTRAWRSTR